MASLSRAGHEHGDDSDDEDLDDGEEAANDDDAVEGGGLTLQITEMTKSWNQAARKQKEQRVKIKTPPRAARAARAARAVQVLKQQREMLLSIA